MNSILLNNHERYFIEDKFFLVKKGKVITRNILENGKLIANEYSLNPGDLVGNIFKLSQNDDFPNLDMDIEVEAIEDGTILEELYINSEKISNDFLLSKLINSLSKRILASLFFHIYDSKGYILAILKLYFSDKKYIFTDNIHFENFNLSKSQFYLIFSKLKKEGYIHENGNKLTLNIKKIDEYLMNFGE